jgi:exopolysaccharide biosynthesis polyprenyl glycosylphosphotransferase
MKYIKGDEELISFVPSSIRTGVEKSTLRHTAQWRLLTAVLVVHDLLMIYLAFQVAYLLRFQSSLALFELNVVPTESFYERLTLILLPVWLALFALQGLYNRQKLHNGTHETAMIFNATAASVLVVVAGEFFWTIDSLARGWLVVAWLCTFAFTALGRYLIRRFVQRLRCRGILVYPAIIVGANQEGSVLAEQLNKPEYSGLQLVGFVDDTAPAGSAVDGNSLHVLGPLSAIDSLVERYGIEEIIIASSALDEQQIIQLFTRYGVSDDVNIRLSSGLYQIITTGLEVTEMAFVPLVKINKVRLTGFERVAKEVVDFAVAGLLTLILLPLFAVITLLVRLDSPGPVIHRRRVMGVNGQQFDAYKFRTMYVNGDEILAARPDLLEELAREQKLKDDPRITRIGRILRKTSFDELPQLINVMRNQMSLVGPRMISPPEMNYYKQMGLNLLTVKPGITGLWQVSGRSDLAYEERIRLDMYYIRNWSLWLDMQLLWRTIPAVLSHQGAY